MSSCSSPRHSMDTPVPSTKTKKRRARKGKDEKSTPAGSPLIKQGYRVRRANRNPSTCYSARPCCFTSVFRHPVVTQNDHACAHLFWVIHYMLSKTTLLHKYLPPFPGCLARVSFCLSFCLYISDPFHENSVRHAQPIDQNLTRNYVTHRCFNHQEGATQLTIKVLTVHLTLLCVIIGYARTSKKGPLHPQ